MTPSVSHIQGATAEHYNITVDELVGKSRQRVLANIRHIAVFVASDVTGNSTTQLAWAFGRRHHTTIMNSIQRTKDMISRGEAMADISAIKRRAMTIADPITAVQFRSRRPIEFKSRRTNMEKDQ